MFQKVPSKLYGYSCSSTTECKPTFTCSSTSYSCNCPMYLTSAKCDCPANTYYLPSGSCGSTTNVVRSATPAISWNDPNTVSHTLSVSASGSLMSITVTVSITHSFKGNLRVVLTSPSQVSVDLHRYTGGGGNNVIGSYPTTLTPYDSLSLIYGTQINGNWKLTIYNEIENGRTGTLNSWSININYVSY